MKAWLIGHVDKITIDNPKDVAAENWRNYPIELADKSAETVEDIESIKQLLVDTLKEHPYAATIGLTVNTSEGKVKFKATVKNFKAKLNTGKVANVVSEVNSLGGITTVGWVY